MKTPKIRVSIGTRIPVVRVGDDMQLPPSGSATACVCRRSVSATACDCRPSASAMACECLADGVPRGPASIRAAGPPPGTE